MTSSSGLSTPKRGRKRRALTAILPWSLSAASTLSFDAGSRSAECIAPRDVWLQNDGGLVVVLLRSTRDALDVADNIEGLRCDDICRLVLEQFGKRKFLELDAHDLGEVAQLLRREFRADIIL